jgi:hypothetical protein
MLIYDLVMCIVNVGTGVEESPHWCSNDMLVFQTAIWILHWGAQRSKL